MYKGSVQQKRDSCPSSVFVVIGDAFLKTGYSKKPKTNREKVLSYPNCNKFYNVLLNNSFNPPFCCDPPDFIVVLHFLFSIDCLLVLYVMVTVFYHPQYILKKVRTKKKSI